MSGQFKRVTPKFYTTHLQQTRTFYEQILGFTCLAYEPDWGWSLYGRDHVQIMYTLPNEHLPFREPMFTGSIYIYLETAIEELWLNLKDQVQVAYSLNSFEYGMREFAIYDNNGYMLQFGQEIAEENL